MSQNKQVSIEYKVRIHYKYDYDGATSEFSVDLDEDMLDNFDGFSEAIFRTAEKNAIKRWKELQTAKSVKGDE